MIEKKNHVDSVRQGRQFLQLKEVMVNCSQTKFVAIILELSIFFYAIFRLIDFSSEIFDFSYSKTG